MKLFSPTRYYMNKNHFAVSSSPKCTAAFSVPVVAFNFSLSKFSLHFLCLSFEHCPHFFFTFQVLMYGYVIFLLNSFMFSFNIFTTNRSAKFIMEFPNCPRRSTYSYYYYVTTGISILS